MMDRRAFLLVAGATVMGCRAARAQSAGKVFRIGRLSPLSATADAAMIQGLRQGLQDLGWHEGKDFALEFRFADGNLDRLSALVTELVRLEVDVLVTGSDPGARAAQNATRSIPIVMVTTGDPVASGIVDSLARPGGNITGVSSLGQEVSAKGLELIRQALPSVRGVAVLTNPESPYRGPQVRQLGSAAQVLGLQLQILDARNIGEIEAAFAQIDRAHVAALLVPLEALFITHGRRISELALRDRVPVMCGDRRLLAAGGLIGYGASLPHMYRRAATYVDKILKGAKPTDLPIEQPTTFELVINLKTARALGLTIPEVFLALADEVIE
jgi:putative tryptophan/tyrosine transport system substrate-binding protein